MYTSTGIAWLSSVRNENCHVKLCLTNETHGFNYNLQKGYFKNTAYKIKTFDEGVDDRQVIMVLYKTGLSACYIEIYKPIQKCELK
jgi:hypothetical protein